MHVREARRTVLGESGLKALRFRDHPNPGLVLGLVHALTGRTAIGLGRPGPCNRPSECSDRPYQVRMRTVAATSIILSHLDGRTLAEDFDRPQALESHDLLYTVVYPVLVMSSVRKLKNINPTLSGPRCKTYALTGTERSPTAYTSGSKALYPKVGLVSGCKA